MQNIVKKYKIQFEEKFFNVSVEKCIERDLGRKNPVGEAIIRGMYNKYLKTPIIKTDNRFILKQDPRLPKCIIVDLDGTLALHNGRGPFDYAKCGTDIVNIPVKHIVQSYGLLYDYTVMDTDGEEENYIIILSGRDEICRNESLKWLDDNNIPFNHLFMRPKGDYRKDAIVKQEIYEREIKGKYYVEFILDDRDQVVKMWRDLGLLCLQVYYGDF